MLDRGHARKVALGLLVAVIATASLPRTTGAREASSEAKYVGRQVCAACHVEVSESFGRTLHSQVRGWGEREVMDCETCHGPGSRHVNAGGRGGVHIVNPRDLAPGEAAAICARCHEGKPGQVDWQFSPHAGAEVSCIDCHRVHSRNRDPRKGKGDLQPRLLARAQPELCVRCHAEKRAQMLLPSHHPIREGRMLCTDCHNPHGGGLSAWRNAPEARELCLTCHSRQQGPFAYSHPPAEEDCLLCHRPHGSSEDRLLVSGEPFLCLRCHTVTHSQHDVATPPGTPPPLSQQLLFFSRCTVCHLQVHGSDLDRRLTR